MSKKRLIIVLAILVITGFGLPLMAKLYGILPPVITALLVLAAIVLLVVTERKREAHEPMNEELCSDIAELTVKAGKRNVIIAPSKRYAFSGETEGVLSYIENGVWVVDASKAAETAHNAEAVNISFPETMHFKRFRLESDTGSVIASGVVADDMTLDMHGGVLDARNIFATNLRMGCGQGKITIHAGISGDAAVSCGSGSIDFIAKNELTDFNITAMTGMGTIKAGEYRYGGEYQRSGEINNNAAHTLKLSCGMGRISMTFRQAVTEHE